MRSFGDNISARCRSGDQRHPVWRNDWGPVLRYAPTPARVSGVTLPSSLLSQIVIHFVVGEPIFPSTVVGLALIVTGIVFQRMQTKKCGSDEKAAVTR